jgi:hypothetical protein
VINLDEVVIDEVHVKAVVNQVGQLQKAASGYPDRCWAVESARGLGYLVSQQLVAAGGESACYRSGSFDRVHMTVRYM